MPHYYIDGDTDTEIIHHTHGQILNYWQSLDQNPCYLKINKIFLIKNNKINENYSFQQLKENTNNLIKIPTNPRLDYDKILNVLLMKARYVQNVFLTF